MEFKSITTCDKDIDIYLDLPIFGGRGSSFCMGIPKRVSLTTKFRSTLQKVLPWNVLPSPTPTTSSACHCPANHVHPDCPFLAAFRTSPKIGYSTDLRYGLPTSISFLSHPPYRQADTINTNILQSSCASKLVTFHTLQLAVSIEHTTYPSPKQYSYFSEER